MADAKVQVIIQARLGSARLPAKALLSVAGLPTVVLCAKRAGNTGLPVLVATSDDPDDDAITNVLTSYGVSYKRGPTHDVLRRYLYATQGLPDDIFIVRLTADNLFPDGEFVEMLLEAFDSNRMDYLGCSSPLDGLPYGLSAEIFTLEALRQAAEATTDGFQREHVTPWIKCHTRAQLFQWRRPNVAHLRCTMDSLTDYVRVVRAFSGVDDPVSIGWKDLVERIAAQPDAPHSRCPFRKRPDGRLESELALGTAQLGMNYGIANRDGPPAVEEAREMVNMAIEHGITALDTARSYGQSEARLGSVLDPALRKRVTIVTKLSPLDDLSMDAGEPSVNDAVDASVFRSCRELRVHRLDVLLLHRWIHRTAYSGTLWKRLLDLQTEGIIGTLGASVCFPDEAAQALKDPDVGHLQLPYNLLDWRWRCPEFQQAVIARPDVNCHIRSVLLQGLLNMSADQWPDIAHLNIALLLSKVDDLVVELGRDDRIDLCIAYVRAHEWVTSLVIGMENVEQVKRNIGLFQRAPLTKGERELVDNRLPLVPELLLNPTSWKESLK